MPVYATPQPISVSFDVVCATVRFVASDRADTTVLVRPADEHDKSDVRAAAATRVEFNAGRLLVRGPRLRSVFRTSSDAVDVLVELPTGSSVEATVSLGDVHAEGRLGDCRVRTSAGDISLAETGAARLRTGMGRVVLGHADGHTEVTTGTGEVWVEEIDGPGVLKNSNGETRVGRISGDLRVNSANGRVSVDRAGGAVSVKSAVGGVRLGEVSAGVVELDVAAGDLEVGIAEGTAAYLDLNTRKGRVLNTMQATEAPTDPTGTVEVRARTQYGDIVIRRSDNQ